MYGGLRGRAKQCAKTVSAERHTRGQGGEGGGAVWIVH